VQHLPSAAPTEVVAGVQVDAESGATFTIQSDAQTTPDRAKMVQTTNNTTSTAVTVPQAGSTSMLGYYPFVHCNTGSVVATDTPTTSTINGNTTAVLVGKVSGHNPECMFWWSDAGASTGNWWGGEILPTDANGRLAAEGMPAFTGDVTKTAGSLATTVTAINGTAFPASAALLASNSSSQPTAVTVGTGVITAIGTNVGSAGAFVVNGGALGTPSSGTLTSATGYVENALTGSAAAGTITEGGSTFSVTRAGVSTANLTSPWVFQNTNSTNNNTSLAAAFTTPGTSTGQVTVNINGATTQASLLQFTTGATYTAGVQSGATDVADVLPTGSIQTKGTTAGFVALSQGSTSASVVPCSNANTHCIQANSAVTAGVETDAPALAQGIPTRVGSSSAITDGYTGDAGHSATVSWSTATTVGSTSLCSTTNCPAGTYRVNVYIDVTTACTTTGSYVVNVIWTDDTTVSKTSVIPLVGLGVTPTFGPTAITATLVPTSTTDFGMGSFILRSTGTTSINYSTTAGACATGGPGVGKLYFSVEPLQ
jgi:hypothetical protein